MNFVRIGERVINFSNVTFISHTVSGGVSGKRTQFIMSFVGETDNYLAIDSEIEPAAYQALAEWVESFPSIETMGGPTC